MTTRETTREEVDSMFRGAQAVGLTEEDKKRLTAPFPRSVIKSFTGKGGKEMRYIDVEVLEARLEEVDPNWEKRVTPGTNGVAVHYVIKGVMRGDIYDNDDESNKYGKPQVNALSRASRRSLRKFGVGADMWEDDEASEAAEDTKVREFKRPAQKSGSSQGTASGSPSEKQVKWLSDLHVPQAVIERTTAGKEGTASQLITVLMELRKQEDDYNDEPLPYIERALKKIDRKLIPLLDEEDEDED